MDLKTIRVNCVAPGAVNTELIQSSSVDRQDAVLKDFGGHDDHRDGGPGGGFG